jgi:16S rRNA (guanine527-N7)-methyltransferase
VELAELLEESRSLGFLGPGPVREHEAHAEAMLALVPAGVASLLDLGSGGGVPGLVLAARLPGVAVTLLEGGDRRAAFLERALRSLQLGDRCTVLAQRAEVAGRDATLRGSFDVVVARSFGSPAVTAECAAPLLRVGGRLIVSDTPTPDPERWPEEPLAALGLRFVGIEGAGPHFAVLEQMTPCPDRFPRKTGIPERRPLWDAGRFT